MRLIRCLTLVRTFALQALAEKPSASSLAEILGPSYHLAPQRMSALGADWSIKVQPIK